MYHILAPAKPTPTKKRSTHMIYVTAERWQEIENHGMKWSEEERDPCVWGNSVERARTSPALDKLSPKVIAPSSHYAIFLCGFHKLRQQDSSPAARSKSTRETPERARTRAPRARCVVHGATKPKGTSHERQSMFSDLVNAAT